MFSNAMVNEFRIDRSAFLLAPAHGNQIVGEPKELFFSIFGEFGIQNNFKRTWSNIDDGGGVKAPRQGKKLGSRNIGRREERGDIRGTPGRVYVPTITLLIRICAPDLPPHRFGRGACPRVASATLPRLR